MVIKPQSRYAQFVLSACRQRERLIRQGKSRMKTAECYRAMKELKRFLEFYGHKGDGVLRGWMAREKEKIKLVIPPSWEKRLKEMIQE